MNPNRKSIKFNNNKKVYWKFKGSNTLCLLMLPHKTKLNVSSQFSGSCQ